MLEQWEWVISPWRRMAGFPDAPPLDAHWTRFVLDPATRSPLGFVRQTRASASRWPWQRTTRFEMQELPDASHLFTLTRSWWRHRQWKVYDAEDAFVGRIHGSRLVDPWGRCHGRLDDKGILRDADDRVLARIERCPDLELRVQICFEEASPFWKMLALGMSVVRELPAGVS